MTVLPGPLGAIPPTWRSVLDGWLQEVALTHSPELQAVYGRGVADALARMGVADLQDLSLSALTLYRAELVLAGDPDGSPRSGTVVTLTRRLAMLRSFLRYAERTGACPLSAETVARALPLPGLSAGS